MKRLRLHVIGCPVFQRELEVLATEAKTDVAFRYLDMGLHEGSAGNLRATLQGAIDGATDGPWDAIAITYGLCSRGIVGLQARTLPVVIPRAHDCLGMLLGSTPCYLAQLEAQPGTYFQSVGWLEHSPANGEIRQQHLPFGPGFPIPREQLLEKYGAENADYLLEQFAGFTRHCRRLAFIATPVPKVTQWEKAARKTARARGWQFERLPGDLGWLRRLINAEWNDREFLRLQPGERVGPRSDALLIGAEPA
jgi:hypothetical protein